MTKKFWKTQKFKLLKIEWEGRLKKSGFIDIEDHRERLKQNASNSYRTTTLEIIETKRRYYELLCQGYSSEKNFRDSVERIVMLLRSRGCKIKHICQGLERVKERCHEDTVRKIIRFYEAKWEVKRR